MLSVLPLTLAALAYSLSVPPQLDLVSPLSDNDVFLNESLSNPTTQNLTATPSFYCDQRYGIITIPEPCHDAYLKIPIYAKDQEFIYRRYGHGSGYESLPVRFLSNDGLCAMDIEIKPQSVGDIAGGDTIANQARHLLENCVYARRKGGNIKPLGARGEISIAVRSYDPQVQCDESKAQAPPSASCGQALAQILVDGRNRLFAKSRDGSGSGVTLLPKRFYQGPCQIEIDTSSESLITAASYLEIWRAGVAVNTMCVQFGKAGTASGIGNNRQMSISLSTTTPSSH